MRQLLSKASGWRTGRAWRQLHAWSAARSQRVRQLGRCLYYREEYKAFGRWSCMTVHRRVGIRHAAAAILLLFLPLPLNLIIRLPFPHP